jgi:nucleoside-triphosphatase THEP1
VDRSLSRLRIPGNQIVSWGKSHQDPSIFFTMGFQRTRLTVHPRRQVFICRHPAFDSIVLYLKGVFSSSYGKPPICTVLGSPGSGKSELFSQMIHAFNCNDFANLGSPEKIPGDRTDILCIAVTLSCYTPLVAQIESKYRLSELVVLRLYYIWYASEEEYGHFIERIDLETVLQKGIRNVIEMILSQAGKSRCILLIDEPIKLTRVQDADTFTRGITELAVAQDERLAIIFSSLLLHPFLLEATSSRRDIVKVSPNLLDRNSVAQELLPHLLPSIPDLLAIQCATCGGTPYLGLAMLFGGFPRLIEYAVKWVQDYGEVSTTALSSGIIKRYTDIENIDVAKFLNFDVVSTALLDTSEGGLKFDGGKFSSDDLVKAALFQRQMTATVQYVIVPQFTLSLFCRHRQENAVGKEKALIEALLFMIAAEGVNGTGIPWEYCCASADRVLRAIRGSLESVTLHKLYKPLYTSDNFVGHTLTDRIRDMRFDASILLETVAPFPPDHQFNANSVDELVSTIWFPSDTSNAGFDYIGFLAPIGKARCFENLIAILVECKFSQEGASTALDWATVISKQQKAVTNATTKMGLVQANIVFRVCSWRKMPEPTETTVDSLPVNIIVQTKKDLSQYMGNSLSVICDNLCIFTA